MLGPHVRLHNLRMRRRLDVDRLQLVLSQHLDGTLSVLSVL